MQSQDTLLNLRTAHADLMCQLQGAEAGLLHEQQGQSILNERLAEAEAEAGNWREGAISRAEEQLRAAMELNDASAIRLALDQARALARPLPHLATLTPPSSYLSLPCSLVHLPSHRAAPSLPLPLPPPPSPHSTPASPFRFSFPASLPAVSLAPTPSLHLPFLASLPQPPLPFSDGC